MNVLIRADASILIGSGHIMRCLTLASELKKHQMEVSFLSRTHDANLNYLIQQSGFNVISLKNHTKNQTLSGYQKWLGCSENKDADECIQHLKVQHYDWVIIDHYALGELWQNKIRSYVCHIMVIDDLANRMYDADLLLDQTYLRTSKSYENLTPKNCRLIMGTQYALLRNEFSAHRKKSLARRQSCNQRNIVISMGGADPQNLSSNIIEELADCPNNTFNDVILILGEQNPHSHNLKSLIKRLNLNITLKVAVTNMAHILSNADIAIGAAGSSAWERCCLGVPTIQVVFSENQQLIADNLAADDIALPYKKNTLCEQLKKTISQYQYYSEKAAAICDGLGTQRVVQHILSITSK